MAWLFLVLAGLFEMYGVMMISKLHKNYSGQDVVKLLLGFGGSFFLLSLAMKSLPMGTAYAVWTGIGASGGAFLGMLLHGESRDLRRVAFIILILGAAVGLKVIA